MPVALLPPEGGVIVPPSMLLPPRSNELVGETATFANFIPLRPAQLIVGVPDEMVSVICGVVMLGFVPSSIGQDELPLHDGAVDIVPDEFIENYSKLMLFPPPRWI